VFFLQIVSQCGLGVASIIVVHAMYYKIFIVSLVLVAASFVAGATQFLYMRHVLRPDIIEAVKDMTSASAPTREDVSTRRVRVAPAPDAVTALV
jgi:hypothetical protein